MKKLSYSTWAKKQLIRAHSAASFIFHECSVHERSSLIWHWRPTYIIGSCSTHTNMADRCVTQQWNEKGNGKGCLIQLLLAPFIFFTWWKNMNPLCLKCMFFMFLMCSAAWLNENLLLTEKIQLNGIQRDLSTYRAAGNMGWLYTISEHSLMKPIGCSAWAWSLHASGWLSKVVNQKDYYGKLAGDLLCICRAYEMNI